MGLLNFWKKKASDQLVIPPIDSHELLTDLPPIEGDKAGDSVDGSNMQSYGNIQKLPSLDDSEKSDGSKSISFNVPTLDFSLPPNDDVPESKMSSSPKLAAPKAVENTHILSQPEDDKPLMDLEDLNHLFLNDEDWKEPDWENFEPYTEEKIDEPKPEDFKGELPEFDEDVDRASISRQSILEPSEPYVERVHSGQKPVELYIRGKAYSRVFVELNQMNQSLSKIDSQMDRYEDMLKQEEPLLIVAKDQMEYVYKRLNQVDKKIFVQ